MIDSTSQTTPKSLETKGMHRVDRRNVTQRVLLGMAAICGVLSAIPPLNLGASLALRGITLLSAASAKSSPEKQGKLIYALRITAIVLGILALAITFPLLMVVSLSVDSGMRVGLIAQALYHKEYLKALIHIILLAVDLLSIGGFLLGSWKLMVAATGASCLVLLGLALHACLTGKPDMALSYSALMAAGVVGASLPVERTRWPTRPILINKETRSEDPKSQPKKSPPSIRKIRSFSIPAQQGQRMSRFSSLS